MDYTVPQKYERYLIYPNESIDKLTVNRSFERMFEDIDKKTSSPTLSVSYASDKAYGTVRYSSLDSYKFDADGLDEEELADYENSALTISLLKDYSSSITNDSVESVFLSPYVSSGTTELEEHKYWIKMDFLDTNFVFSPNGNLAVNCTFDIGFNNIPATFGTDAVLSGDIISPVVVNGYRNYVNITKEDYYNFTDFINDDSYRDPDEKFDDIDKVMELTEFDGHEIEIPFIEPVNAVLRHNVCNWTTYSAYRQSYVEIHFSSSLSVKSLYESKYGRKFYRQLKYDGDSVEQNSMEVSKGAIDHPQQYFTQRPIIMSQIGFYNNSSNPSPIFGFDDTPSKANGNSEPRSEFEEYNRISQKKLDEIERDGKKFSPVNGNVSIKRYENIYDSDGNIVDNRIHFDITLKFMTGSASDPEMIYGLQNINSKAKIQIAMLGV